MFLAQGKQWELLMGLELMTDRLHVRRSTQSDRPPNTFYVNLVLVCDIIYFLSDYFPSPR